MIQKNDLISESDPYGEAWKKPLLGLLWHILRFVVPGFRIDPLTAGGTSVAVFGLEIIHIDRRTASFAGDGDNSFVPRYFFVFFIRRHADSSFWLVCNENLQ